MVSWDLKPKDSEGKKDPTEDENSSSSSDQEASHGPQSETEGTSSSQQLAGPSREHSTSESTEPASSSGESNFRTNEPGRRPARRLLSKIVERLDECGDQEDITSYATSVINSWKDGLGWRGTRSIHTLSLSDPDAPRVSLEGAVGGSTEQSTGGGRRRRDTEGPQLSPRYQNLQVETTSEEVTDTDSSQPKDENSPGRKSDESRRGGGGGTGGSGSSGGRRDGGGNSFTDDGNEDGSSGGGGNEGTSQPMGTQSPDSESTSRAVSAGSTSPENDQTIHVDLSGASKGNTKEKEPKETPKRWEVFLKRTKPALLKEMGGIITEICSDGPIRAESGYCSSDNGTSIKTNVDELTTREIDFYIHKLYKNVPKDSIPKLGPNGTSLDVRKLLVRKKIEVPEVHLATYLRNFDYFCEETIKRMQEIDKYIESELAKSKADKIPGRSFFIAATAVVLFGMYINYRM